MKNTGVHKGKEVVQLYVNKPAGKFDQPYQQLAAFAKTKEIRAVAKCTFEDVKNKKASLDDFAGTLTNE